ncbi:hypothetical protein F930_03387 [Acinetobacter pittii ANC 3678]|nr:hypothetical protein F930_03387 [Acinetobacter pittii ANC 3678]
MFRYILLAIILNGCSNYEVRPREMRVAHVNKVYSENIKITGGKVSEQNFELTSNIPENQEIKITPVDDIDGCNHIKIEGIPKYKENTKL